MAGFVALATAGLVAPYFLDRSKQPEESLTQTPQPRNTTPHQRPKLRVTSIGQLEDFFVSNGIKPRIDDAGSDRYLVLAADWGGSIAQDLIKNVASEMLLDKVYLEGAVGQGQNFSALDGRDHSRISKEVPIIGVEDKRMYDELMKSDNLPKILNRVFRYGMKDEKAELALRSLASQLKVLPLKLPETLYRADGTANRIYEACLDLEVNLRGKNFSQVIDRTLSKGHTGIFTTSPVFLEGTTSPSGKAYGSIHPHLIDNGINVITVDLNQSVDFNKNYN